MQLDITAVGSSSVGEHGAVAQRTLQPTSRLWKRYSSWMVGVWLAIVAVGLVAIVCGQRASVPNSASAMGFARCGGTPCLRGLSPGQTLWSAELAASHHLWVDEATPFYHIVLLPSQDGARLGLIAIQFPSSTSVTAGDIVQLYGIPCRVGISVYSRWSMVIWYYPQLHVQMDMVDDRLSPDLPVQRIILIDPPRYSSRPQSDLCQSDTKVGRLNRTTSVQRSWQGFTSLQRYLTASNHPASG